jgi:class 3 adenylate cyclase
MALDAFCSPARSHPSHKSTFHLRPHSYVAVTGIPEPQKFHAEIMVKFARDAMLKFSQVVNDLAPSLGDDTAKLEMRIGLHSGPTTGGVLRGDKVRPLLVYSFVVPM